MNNKRHLLRSTTAKTSMAWIIIIIIAAAFVFGYIKIGTVDLTNLHLPFSIGEGGTSGGGNVTRKLQFTFTNKFTGSACGTKTFYLYSPGGALLESLTTGADGIQTTGRDYTTGDILDVKYVDGNSKIWYQVTVPSMSTNDAFSQTYNPIALEAFAIGTYTGTLTSSGTAYATNYADGNGTTPIFKYEVTNTGADGTGMMDSAVTDPVYKQDWKAELVVTITGTGYETIILNGFDYTFTLGTTQYGVKKLDANQLTKWKTGSTYEYGYEGDQTLQFNVDLNGLLVNSTTMTMYARAYADPNYAMAHGGSFGTNVRQLATSTCNFIHYG